MSGSCAIITIDGPAGAGKSTVARLLAERLGFFLLDTGALYRAMALHLMRQGIMPGHEPVPESALKLLNIRMEPNVASMKLFLEAEEVTTVIRQEQIGEAASVFSTRSEVRRALLSLQRSAAAKWNLVAEGRDMGTVVFPDADVKFFLTADLKERAGRRYLELADRGEHPDFEQVLGEMRARDHRDESREQAPLLKAPDAIAIDTTQLTKEEVLDLMMIHIKERMKLPRGCR